MFKKQKLKDKVIAITGAARGIGLATAEVLIAQGAKVRSFNCTRCKSQYR